MSLPSFIAFSAFTLVALIGLIILGTWQMERREEKHVLIEKISARVKAPAMKIESVMDRRARGDDIDYLRVRIAGVFNHAKERYFFATFKGIKGWHVYTPMALDNGRLLLVNRGFVPDGLKSPATRQPGQISGQTSLTGLVRKPAVKGYFDPDNDVARNIWYWRDLENMTASVSDERKLTAYPFFIEAEKRQDTVAWPKGGVTRLAIRDNHLQYALTWYGLAITVIAVYGFFLRNWLQQPHAT